MRYNTHLGRLCPVTGSHGRHASVRGARLGHVPLAPKQPIQADDPLVLLDAQQTFHHQKNGADGEPTVSVFCYRKLKLLPKGQEGGGGGKIKMLFLLACHRRTRTHRVEAVRRAPGIIAQGISGGGGGGGYKTQVKKKHIIRTHSP